MPSKACITQYHIGELEAQKNLCEITFNVCIKPDKISGSC